MRERIKVSKNFFLDEFIDPYTYFNEPDNGLSKIDMRVINITQLLRDKYGKGIGVNSWWWYYVKYCLTKSESDIIKGIENSKTISKWSGIRTSRCKIGASQSAHKTIHGGKGRAADPKGDQDVFFKIVEENAKEFYSEGLRRVEDPSITIGWLHIDVLEKNTKPNSIRVIDRVRCTKTITW